VRQLTSSLMSRSRSALGALLLLSLVLVVPQAANAKGRESFRVVAPSGKVARVAGKAAEAWWHDYFSASVENGRGCSCASSAAAARYAQKVARLWKRWPHPLLLIPATDASMLYYPPTGTTPGYVLTPSALGTKTTRWDDWEVASARMEAIIRKALPAS
jgi:hypothetical protein